MRENRDIITMDSGVGYIRRKREREKSIFLRGAGRAPEGVAGDRFFGDSSDRFAWDHLKVVPNEPTDAEDKSCGGNF